MYDRYQLNANEVLDCSFSIKERLGAAGVEFAFQHDEGGALRSTKVSQKVSSNEGKHAQ